MANSVPSPTPSTSTATDDPVVLVASARFITRNETVPAGVRPRDVASFLEGMIEENSPLPVEYVSWGYLTEAKPSGKERRLLTYAAAKEQVFGTGRRSVPQRPTLPAFAALYGIKVREPGWVFLADSHSLAAVLIRPDQSLPARIHSCFLKTADEEGLWEARTRLVAEIKPSKGEKLLPGLVRVDSSRHGGGRIDFHLKRLPSAGAQWENWQHTRLAPQNAVNHADLRERALLTAQQDQKRNSRSLKLALLLVVLGVFGIIGMESLLHSRAAVAAELADQANRQKDAVKELQQMEVMTKALEATLQRQSRPFELLAALNRKRPETVYIKTMSYADADQLRVNGEADNIQIVNSYTAALREDGFWAEVDLAEVRTETNGAATFQLRLKANKNGLPALPPAANSAEEVPSA